MFKRLLAVALIATSAFTLILSGCGGGQQNTGTGTQTTAVADQGSQTASQAVTTADAKPSEIKYVCFAGSEAGFKARAEEFMKTHANIKVTVQGVPATSWGELMQAIAVNIAGGDVPDCADIASEGQMTFAKNNIVIPLDDYIARDQEELKATFDDINPNLLNFMKVDGKTYFLPTVWNNMCVYYNKKVLAEAGLSDPKPDWTINDFISMGQQVVKNNDGKNDKWGYVFQNGYFLTLVPWMLASGGNVLTDDWTGSRLQDPDTISAINLLHDFVYKYKISPKMDSSISEFDLFVQNKLAFMGAGMWQVMALKNANFSSSDYDVVNFPIGKEKKTVVGIGGTPIFSASKNQDAAWEFVKYLTSKEFQETFVVNDGWSIPAVKSAADMLASKDFAPKNASIFYDSANYGTLVPAPQDYSLIEGSLTRNFSAIMANSVTVDEGMKAADKEIAAALAARSK